MLKEESHAEAQRRREDENGEGDEVSEVLSIIDSFAPLIFLCQSVWLFNVGNNWIESGLGIDE